MRVTITTLASWTNQHRDTIRRKIASLLTGQRGEQVESSTALELIYGDGERLDPSQEKAKLDKTRRGIAELEYQQRKSKLVDAAGVERAAYQFGRILQKTLVDVLPSRVSMEVAAMTDPWEIETFLRNHMRVELESISKLKPEEVDSVA